MQYGSLEEFQADQRLPAEYLASAREHFSPLVNSVLEHLQSHPVAIVGINGSQGSGKSTLAAWLQTVLFSEHGLAVVNMSLDDFYLSKEQRRHLASTVHPLFQTRGVPGTHNMRLLSETLEALAKSEPGSVAIPRFDKSADDPFEESLWDRVNTPVDVVILEGWCLGATPEPSQALEVPINDLEKTQDAEGKWRTRVNEALAGEYQPIFNLVDIWAMLKAPSFDCVFQWRLEQEEKLAKKLQSLPVESEKDPTATGTATRGGLMNAEQIAGFVQYFQRLTEHMLKEMPQRVDHLYLLDQQRRIIDEKHREQS